MTQRLQTSDIKTRLFGNEMSPLSGKVLGFSNNKMRAPFVRLCTAFLLFGCLCLACWHLAGATITLLSFLLLSQMIHGYRRSALFFNALSICFDFSSF